eukprot:TRINITY_DN3666_c1_g2_i2.p1 TRINITY_DN3666_c1_g2~~TRINITY_DN3666_c1_g2_i2.p1  ORF type:complete len:322 (-),score=93.31 TRINITY_DN3666_c1_g2_i2:41-1006(-)
MVPVHDLLQSLSLPKKTNWVVWMSLSLGIAAMMGAMVILYWRFRVLKKKAETPVIEYVQIEKQMDGKFEEKTGRYLARGAFASVAAVRHPNGGMYAMKKMMITSPHIHLVAHREIKILQMLQHDNTIRLRDSVRTADQVTIYTDLFDGTISDLYSKKTFRVRDVVVVAQGLSQALKYLQSLGIAHRDIKPSNLLVSLSGHDYLESVHLADFGLAIFVEKESTVIAETVGSLPYMPPEIRPPLSVQEYDPYAADVFSVGMTLWEVCHGQKFGGRMDLTSPVLLREELQGMKKIITQCRKISPPERWSIDQVLAHLRTMRIED